MSDLPDDPLQAILQDLLDDQRDGRALLQHGSAVHRDPVVGIDTVLQTPNPVRRNRLMAAMRALSEGRWSGRAACGVAVLLCDGQPAAVRRAEPPQAFPDDWGEICRRLRRLASRAPDGLRIQGPDLSAHARLLFADVPPPHGWVAGGQRLFHVDDHLLLLPLDGVFVVLEVRGSTPVILLLMPA